MKRYPAVVFIFLMLMVSGCIGCSNQQVQVLQWDIGHPSYIRELFQGDYWVCYYEGTDKIKYETIFDREPRFYIDKYAYNSSSSSEKGELLGTVWARRNISMFYGVASVYNVSIDYPPDYYYDYYTYANTEFYGSNDMTVKSELGYPCTMVYDSVSDVIWINNNKFVRH